MSNLLKPCPFCGGKARIGREYDQDGFGVFLFVVCDTCRSKTGGKFLTEECPQSHAEVRDDWNNRTDDTEQLRTELEKERERLGRIIGRERERVEKFRELLLQTSNVMIDEGIHHAHKAISKIWEARNEW